MNRSSCRAEPEPASCVVGGSPGAWAPASSNHKAVLNFPLHVTTPHSKKPLCKWAERSRTVLSKAAEESWGEEGEGSNSRDHQPLLDAYGRTAACQLGAREKLHHVTPSQYLCPQCLTLQTCVTSVKFPCPKQPLLPLPKVMIIPLSGKAK